MLSFAVSLDAFVPFTILFLLPILPGKLFNYHKSGIVEGRGCVPCQGRKAEKRAYAGDREIIQSIDPHFGR